MSVKRAPGDLLPSEVPAKPREIQSNLEGYGQYETIETKLNHENTQNAGFLGGAVNDCDKIFITETVWCKMDDIFHRTVSNAFSWTKEYEFWIKKALKCVPKGPIDKLALVQVMT